jgi:class 3 adenylate cyclase/tetratricopeptide (TPR) repeat protein
VGDVAAERKLATVLFADIAGSTELAGRMDAETLRLLLADVYDELSWVVDAYGGTVEKFIGDAVMAVFGVPVAHEDDAERSVRAALVMRSRLGGVALRRGVDVVLRIGVNTGLVVTGTNPGRDFLVTGEAVNLAARLQQAAEPGEILVGERTFAAVEPVVRTAAPRSLRLKGREGPVVAYAVEGLAPASIYRRRRRAYGPFVGRERELALVRALVERSVEHRRPQLVTVIGEPGIGKSRLVEEVVIELQRGLDPPVVWVGRCLPYGEGGPYAPLRDLLLRAAAVSEADSREEARSKVRGQLLALLGDDAAQTVEQVLRFVSPLTVPAEDSDEDPGERGREAWHELLLTFAARRPALLVIDDVHWAEPALLGLVAGVVQGTTRVPLAVVCIGRDELLLNHPTWGSGARNETTITLEALEEEDMRRLAFALAQHGDPSAEVIAQAGGNPFFLEEILAMAGEGAAMVPDTVQGVIAARLDMLPAAEKRLLQRAAVIGRAFDLDTLRALAGEEASAGELRELVTRDFVVQTGGTGHSFKHGLIRDVAYESIARAERARLHMALAGYLDGQGAGRQPVAYHYAAAAGLGLQEARAEAVERLLEAAAEAHSVYAHGSAMRQATRALALAEDDRERAMAQEAVGDAHWMAERSNEAWEAYRLALEHGVKAGLSRHVMARLRWKFVDLPTRWGAGKPMADASDEVQHELELGLADARAVGDRAREARFLVARALTGWHSADRTAQQLEAALRDARAAYAIGGELERPAICSAALDAEAMALLSLSRYADARAAADTRFELVPKLRRREEQIDACTMAARARIGTGDYSGALQAAGTALDLMRGSGQHWLAWPLLERCDAFFWWDRWDEVLDAFQEFLSVYRSTGPRRRSTPPSRATGMAVAVHLLRGDREMADALEQRADLPPEGYHTVAVSHALLGCGEPELALDRLPKIHVGRLGVVAVSAEANAMLERWDVVDALLAEAAASPGLDQAPRLAAQLDRARGMAGDEIALRRAADGFDRLGCRFEHARCLELQGHAARARHVYESLGAVPALDRVSA